MNKHVIRLNIFFLLSGCFFVYGGGSLDGLLSREEHHFSEFERPNVVDVLANAPESEVYNRIIGIIQSAQKNSRHYELQDQGVMSRANDPLGIADDVCILETPYKCGKHYPFEKFYADDELVVAYGPYPNYSNHKLVILREINTNKSVSLSVEGPISKFCVAKDSNDFPDIFYLQKIDNETVAKWLRLKHKSSNWCAAKDWETLEYTKQESH